MSQGVYVLGGKCPGGKCPGGKNPGGICPWGKCPGVHVRGGYVLEPLIIYQKPFKMQIENTVYIPVVDNVCSASVGLSLHDKLLT